jgi:hypothetical protein
MMQSIRQPIMMAAVIMACFVLDCYMAVVFGPAMEFPSMLVVGICIGQVDLLAIWSTLAAGPVVVRLPWSLMLGVLMWYALCLGAGLIGATSEESLIVGVLLLGGIVALQLPLWVVARAFKWQLCGGTAQAAAANPRTAQCQIKHLLCGMFFCAVALALGRTLWPQNMGGLSTEFWGVLAVLLPVLAVGSLITIVPAVWTAFAHWRWLPVLAIAWPLYCGVITLTEVGVLTLFFGTPPKSVYSDYYVANLLQWATVSGVLLILRAVGLELRRRAVRADPDGQIANDACEVG